MGENKTWRARARAAIRRFVARCRELPPRNPRERQLWITAVLIGLIVVTWVLVEV